MADIVSRITALQTPSGGGGMATLALGLINIFFPGIGVIIAGILDNNMTDVVIGVLQLLFAFFILGWIWAIIWGILMIIRSQ